MRKFYPYVMALALMSGSAIYGSAQTAYSRQPAANAFLDDRDHERWEEGRKRAQEVGHEDGFNDGRRDLENHRPFQPMRTGNYKHGDHGYDGRYGDRRRYIDEYRQAYTVGYQEGYKHEEHEQDRERQHEHENPR